MTLAELRDFDIPAAWARLTPEQQAAIGEVTIAWQLASLLADSTIRFEEMCDAYEMADAAETGVADAVEAALPEIDWQPVAGSPSAPPTP